MSGLQDLYREIILDHYRAPRNRGELPVPPAHKAEGFNPLCGDEVVLYLEFDGDRVSDLKIGGQGCSISQASTSRYSTTSSPHSGLKPSTLWAGGTSSSPRFRGER